MDERNMKQSVRNKNILITDSNGKSFALYSFFYNCRIFVQLREGEERMKT